MFLLYYFLKKLLFARYLRGSGQFGTRAASGFSLLSRQTYGPPSNTGRRGTVSAVESLSR